MAAKRDFYEVIGVARDASEEDVRRAFKKEAVKHHPDRNPGDSKAEARFKELNEAYQVLGDDRKRAIYDQYGHAGLEGGGGGGDGGEMFSNLQDLFNDMFSGGGFGGGGGGRGRGRGQDLRVEQVLTLREAAFGCKREISLRSPVTCETCAGSGAKAGTKPETCGHCRGSGQVSAARGFMMFTSPCPKCSGQGQVIRNPCGGCNGAGMVDKQRKVAVNFPAGIDANQRLRVTGQGMPGSKGGTPGDLYVDVGVEEDPVFEREGAELATKVRVTFTEAALGAEIQVPALDATNTKATIPLQVPAGTQAGAVIALKGQGVQRIDGRGRGTLAVIIEVDVPNVLTARARELMAELDRELTTSKGDGGRTAATRAAAAKEK
jgi:molecular chaperone DnaJ